MSFVNVDRYYINLSKISYYFFDGDEVIVSFGNEDYLSVDISLEEFEKICFGKGVEHYSPLG